MILECRYAKKYKGTRTPKCECVACRLERIAVLSDNVRDIMWEIDGLSTDIAEYIEELRSESKGKK